MHRRSLVIGSAVVLLLTAVLAAVVTRPGSSGESEVPTTTVTSPDATGTDVLSSTFDRTVEEFTEWWNAARLSVTADARTGTGALLVQAGSGQSTVVRQTDALVPGHRHRLRVAARGTGGMTAQIIQFDKNWASTATISLPSTPLTDGTWTVYEAEFGIAPTTAHANLAFAADGSTLTLDDLQVSDLGPTPKPTADSATAPSTAQWVPLWSDEFNGTELDRKQWTPDDAPTDYNGELHCYTPCAENLAVRNGTLLLTARRETALPCPGDTRFPQGRQYSSALVRSTSVLREGRVEIRARVPAGKGLWPALWLLPKDAARYKNGRNGEIDIVEVIGSSPDVVHATVDYDYSKQVDGQGMQTQSLTLPVPADRDFHTYALEWERNEMRWYFDDKLYFTSNPSNHPWYPPPGAAWPAPFDQDFYVIMNVGVGGSWPGSPDDTTPFPAEMAVDWVRVFQRASS